MAGLASFRSDVERGIRRAHVFLLLAGGLWLIRSGQGRDGQQAEKSKSCDESTSRTADDAHGQLPPPNRSKISNEPLARSSLGRF